MVVNGNSMIMYQKAETMNKFAVHTRRHRHTPTHTDLDTYAQLICTLRDAWESSIRVCVRMCEWVAGSNVYCGRRK